VHAESRYGIIQLPSFPEGTVDTSAPPPSGEPGGSEPAVGPPAPVEPGVRALGTPETFLEERIVEETVRFSPDPPTPRPIPVPHARGPLERIVRVPVEALRDAINLLVQHPGEFGLLFLLFSLLAAPLYLGSRRRAFARAALAT
jgi:hypothetical protein